MSEAVNNKTLMTMRRNPVGSYFSRRAVRAFAGCGLLLVFCLMAVRPIQAKEVYTGKGTDIFKADSSEIKNQKLLDEILAKLKNAKGKFTLEISLHGVHYAVPGEKGFDFEKERADILKKYFQKNLPGIPIKAAGRTASATVPEQLLKGKYKSNLPTYDTISFIITSPETMGDDDSNTEGQSNYVYLKKWQIELRKRYKKAIQKSWALCQEERPSNRCIEHDCDPDTHTDLEFSLCLLRDERCFIENGDGGDSPDINSIPLVEYDLKRIKKLREVTPEIYAIAKEIMRHEPKEKPIHFNISILDKEIQRNILAIKYIKRGLKIIKAGIKHVAIYGRSHPSDASGMMSAYYDWWQNDEAYSQYYRYKFRGETIDKVRKLHNFIRRHLKMPAIERNEDFPLCVWTHTLILKSHNFSLDFIKHRASNTYST